MARKISDFWEILKYIQGLPSDITEAIGAIAKSEQASADNLLGAIVSYWGYSEIRTSLCGQSPWSYCRPNSI